MTEPILEIEGTWEEVLERSEELRGASVRVTIKRPGHTPKQSEPNEAMLEALRQIDEIWAGRPSTSAEGTDELIREARSGAMYGTHWD
jgi:hypothetical protein